MRAQEFLIERKKSREDFEGITIEMVENGHVLVINALDDWGNNVLGSVAFNIHDNNELDPQDLKVDERYQGQGIAKAMYDYAKSKGYKIHRSYDQTDAGAGFWNKHRGEDVRVWEQRGDKKSAVRRIQKMLNDRFNANLDVDGILGPLTQKSINRFMPSARPGSADDPNRTTAVQGKKLKTDNMAEGKQPGKPVVDAIQKVLPVAQEIWFHGSRATGQHRKNSDTDILVVVPDNLVGDQYLAVVRILQKLASHFDNYDIQPTKSGTNIHRIAQEEGRLLWSNKQGVAEEQLDELSFLGSECTKDCSGHRAGYEWSKRKGLRQANSWSPSFNKGAGLAVAGK
jgi:predicted nucleotidyltransferase/GNAT superfamily N-acetyltransferase